MTLTKGFNSGFVSCANRVLEEEGFFFIAEISNNHLGDMARYKQIVYQAKKAGAHAVKIQTYSAESLCLEASKDNHLIKTGPWSGQTYWDLYKSMEVPLHWTLEIRDYAESIGIPILSSPFSPKDVSFLADNNFDMLKVASGEFSCPELIDSILKVDLPFMASTGFAGSIELEWLHERLNNADKSNYLWCLFNCVSDYPSNISQLDLAKFDLLGRYAPNVGLSDHSMGNSSCLLSFLAGARIFEKHLTLSRLDGGPDGFFSLEPCELADHIGSLRAAASNPSIAGAKLSHSDVYSFEGPSLPFSRSLYAKRDIECDEVLSLLNVGSFRPSHEEPSSVLDRALGRRFLVSLKAGDPVLLKYLD
jgi:pseudaminic acid synthase